MVRPPGAEGKTLRFSSARGRIKPDLLPASSRKPRLCHTTLRVTELIVNGSA